MPTPEPETEVPTPTQNSKEKTGEFFSSFSLGRHQGKWMERGPIQTMISNRPIEVRSQGEFRRRVRRSGARQQATRLGGSSSSAAS